jgi:hypothetical protein
MLFSYVPDGVDDNLGKLSVSHRVVEPNLGRPPELDFCARCVSSDQREIELLS